MHGSCSDISDAEDRELREGAFVSFEKQRLDFMARGL
jgi:hypothetical protein